ncbi:hypothetical protein Tco_0624506 [Tanacetum coccineum]|uniref:Uncharacterized protein n=1 Tax=Tanacetum coccineum TaxID=301880 RepID=A0ABQ4WE55_9ASTR
METQKPLLKDEDGEEVDCVLVLDTSQFQKVTSSCREKEVLQQRLSILWLLINFMPVQEIDSGANSTTDAVYVAVLVACGQVLWFRINYLIWMRLSIGVGWQFGEGCHSTSSLEESRTVGNIYKIRSKATTMNLDSLETTSGGGSKVPRNHRGYNFSTRFENISKLSNDSLLVREQEVSNEKDDDGEITLAQALIEMKSTKPKVNGVVIQEPEPVKPKKKDVQIMLDEEAAKKLLVEFDEEERLARDKDGANVALTEEWDDI